VDHPNADEHEEEDDDDDEVVKRVSTDLEREVVGKECGEPLGGVEDWVHALVLEVVVELGQLELQESFWAPST
jgi:hypothetical protein